MEFQDQKVFLASPAVIMSLHPQSESTYISPATPQPLEPIHPKYTPEMTAVWTCCACGDGPSIVAVACLFCGHTRCGSCPVTYVSNDMNQMGENVI
ncbi:hypothetical protein P152DRAFT_453567 [Eremomyces bilateralis CBS 781.70]|uniref:Uncharacterized protein n=1 Tax=Eremomyces bilateralis CBS 781.70 TaxID=1392243 RepID=A0A6G1GFT6_9PEZI|nr:uncharacterized protein P152DRAFT_453567 [Eremomyces bilateralis CBS 781.70]KAF1816965.1 hypothetical protein P152DRAFT_453567 [Eremomyces bilateralis CBS 781.70]